MLWSGMLSVAFALHACRIIPSGRLDCLVFDIGCQSRVCWCGLWGWASVQSLVAFLVRPTVVDALLQCHLPGLPLLPAASRTGPHAVEIQPAAYALLWCLPRYWPAVTVMALSIQSVAGPPCWPGASMMFEQACYHTFQHQSVPVHWLSLQD